MKNSTRVAIVLCISTLLFLAEISVGFHTRSLALTADAFHYFNDIVTYTMAFVAAYLQENGKHNANFTFAFLRADIVGKFFNGTFLLALALSIFLQSVERFLNIQPIESPVQVLIVGCIGLCLNIISVLIVHGLDRYGHGSHSKALVINGSIETLQLQDSTHALHGHTIDTPIPEPQHNMKPIGVLIHLLGDVTNNLAVIFVAVVIWKVQSPQRFYVDPAVAIVISLAIFGGAISMSLKSGRILLEAVPSFLDLKKVKDDLLAVPGVRSVHDLHVWHLSQSIILASLHVCVSTRTTMEKWEKTERHLQRCFSAYGISHVTISPEIERDSLLRTQDSGVLIDWVGLPQDQFGCAPNKLKKCS